MPRHGKMILILTGLQNALSSDLGLAISDLLQNPHTVEHPGYGMPLRRGPSLNSLLVSFDVPYDEIFNGLHYDAVEALVQSKSENGMLMYATDLALTLVELNEDNETVKEAWSVNCVRAIEYISLNRVEEEGGNVLTVEFNGLTEPALFRGSDLRADCQEIIHDNIDEILHGGKTLVYHVGEVFPGMVIIEADPLPGTYEETIARVGKAMKEADDQVKDPVQKSFLKRVAGFLSGNND